MTQMPPIDFPDAPDDAPEGYFKIAYGAPETFAGPYFEAPALGRVGFRVKPRHANHAGLCHGGVIATFCDLQVRPIKLREGLVNFSPTISMAIDYVESGRLGDWVWMEPQLVKRTGKMLFSQALVMVEDRVIARTNATYRILSHDLQAPEPAVSGM